MPVLAAPRRRDQLFPPPPTDDTCLAWLHGLAVKSCGWWTATSGDEARLVWTSNLCMHLLRWAVREGRIPNPGFVLHAAAEAALDPVYRAHRDAATAEARRYVMGLADARGAVLAAERAEAGRKAKEEAERLAIGGDS